MKWMKTLAVMMFALFTLVSVPASAGPLGPDTVVPGVHPQTWGNRWRVVEATAKHIQKAFPEAVKSFTDSNWKCLKARIAFAQAQAFAVWIGKDINPTYYASEMQAVEFLRQSMRDQCGGGGSGGNPAIEVYNRWYNLLGTKALADLIKLAEAADGLKGFTPAPIATAETAKNTIGTAAFWGAVKHVFLLQLNNAYTMTETTVKVNRQNWKNFVARADSDPNTRAALMTMGLIIVVVGSPVLLF